MKVVPDKWKHGAHHWLILHGRYTCKARKPDCPVCVVREFCPYKDKTPAVEGESIAFKPRRPAAS